MKLIRTWISLCDSGHHECQPSTTGLRGSLRLIDVNQECLVDVLWGQGVHYFALSYTWGSQRPQLILTKHNKSNLYATGGIQNPSRTIIDAMDLVNNLSERYLWVDALCIIQDDAIDKAVHIPSMKAI
jgi:Heterokaryon incompatibility protein (HET)